MPTPVRDSGSNPPLRSGLMLAAFLAISFAVAALGTITTIDNVDGWYAHATKAPWNPPSWLFGPVWSVLYGAMSIAAWRVWLERHRVNVRRPLALYVSQLVLNALWTPVFFGLYPVIGPPALWTALVIILMLDVLVLMTMLAFWDVSRLAGWLFAPYLAWVLFATTLNAAIALLNS